MIRFLWGAVAMGSWTVGLFFLRFWAQTKDRFFLLFGLAFFALCVNWIGLALTNSADEARTLFYLVRLLAFLLILGAIWDKNRKTR